jgi:hypothetical protein
MMLLAGLTGCVTISSDPYHGSRLPDPKMAQPVSPTGLPGTPVTMATPNTMPTGMPGTMPRYSEWQAHPGHTPAPAPAVPAAPSPLALAKGSLPGSLQPHAMPELRPVPAAAATMPPLVPGTTPEMPRGLLTATTPPDATQEVRQTSFASAATPSRMETRLPEIINGAAGLASKPSEAPNTIEISGPPERSQPTPAPKTETAAAATSEGTVGKLGGAPLLRLVNTKRITLNFEVADVGSSGIASVDLWYTQDGREWKKHQAPTSAKAYIVEVDEEGMYGFTLVARSGIGLGQEPPAAGDQPQVWVIVDLTKPDVQLKEVTPVAKGKDQEVSIKWSASDKNLGRNPVTLSYAETEEGPWHVIAANLESTGQFHWKVPAGVPAKVFLRAEASDLAGNLGRGQWDKPILMDASLPKVSIVNVEANSGR